MHFPKAYDNSYSKTNREHKYKDKDESSRITSVMLNTLKRKQFYIFWLESPFSSSYSLSTVVHHLCPPQMLDAKGNCQCLSSLFASGSKTKPVPYSWHMYSNMLQEEKRGILYCRGVCEGTLGRGVYLKFIINYLKDRRFVVGIVNVHWIAVWFFLKS